MKGVWAGGTPEQDAYMYKYTCMPDCLTYAVLNNINRGGDESKTLDFIAKVPSAKAFLSGMRRMMQGGGWYWRGLDATRDHFSKLLQLDPDARGRCFGIWRWT